MPVTLHGEVQSGCCHSLCATAARNTAWRRDPADLTLAGSSPTMMPLMQPRGEGRRRRLDLPGAAHLVLAEGVVHLDEAAAVFQAMLDGWARQQRSRLLADETVRGRLELVRRFQAFTGEYPWQWTPGDVEDYTARLLSGDRPRAHSTIRNYHNALELFCEYVTDPRYDWTAECLARFGEHPVQICHEGNTAQHLVDYEGRPSNRPLTSDELQALFDHADARVEAIVRRGRKGALAALRDAQMLKTAYAFGLRAASWSAWTWPTCASTRTWRSGAATGRCTCAGARRPRAAHQSGAPCWPCRSSTGRSRGCGSGPKRRGPGSALASIRPYGSPSGPAGWMSVTSTTASRSSVTSSACLAS
jgi:hypothetical protein